MNNKKILNPKFQTTNCETSNFKRLYEGQQEISNGKAGEAESIAGLRKQLLEE